MVLDHALCSARGWLGQWARGWGGLCFDLDLGGKQRSQKGIARGGGGAEGNGVGVRDVELILTG